MYISSGTVYSPRYYFQLVATEVLIAQGFYGIIKKFGWRRVGIIVQDENLFTAVRIQLYVQKCMCYVLHSCYNYGTSIVVEVMSCIIHTCMSAQ